MKNEIKTAYEGKFNSYSGHVIDILNPTIDMIHPIDIAQGLGKICRFGGQLSHFYSVAQHSMLVAHLAPKELKRAALLHDASEAYLGDVISPLKHVLAELYKPIELNFEKAIFNRFNEPFENLARIKEFDIQAYRLESSAFKKGDIKSWGAMWKKEFGQDSNVWPANYAIAKYWSELSRTFHKEI